MTDRKENGRKKLRICVPWQKIDICWLVFNILGRNKLSPKNGGGGAVFVIAVSDIWFLLSKKVEKEEIASQEKSIFVFVVLTPMPLSLLFFFEIRDIKEQSRYNEPRTNANVRSGDILVSWKEDDIYEWLERLIFDNDNWFSYIMQLQCPPG